MQPFIIESNIGFIGDLPKQEITVLLSQPTVANFVHKLNEKTFEILKLPIIIGRNTTVNLITNWRYRDVSRKHAEIFEEKDVIKIKDLGTKTGTILLRRRKPIVVTKEGIELQNEDILHLGASVKLTILFEKPGILGMIKNFFS